MMKNMKCNWKLWVVFILIVVVSQSINLWETFPEYSGKYVFGFPLIYYQVTDGANFAYFDVLSFIIDMIIWYIAARFIIYGYDQLGKYKIMK